MPNLKAMKWRKEDEKKLSKAVRKFNASITNLSKKNPEIAESGLYPEKLNIKALRSNILSRADYNRTIASIERWFKPKSREIITKSGIMMIRYSYNESVYQYQRQLAAYKKAWNESRGNLRVQAQIGSRPIPPSEKLMALELRRKTKAQYGEDSTENIQNSWAVYQMRLKRNTTDKYIQETNNLFYSNYVKSLDENFTPEHANDIQALMYTLQLTGYELYLLTTIQPDLDIEFIYGPDTEEEKYNYINESLYKTYWRAVREGLIEMR